MASARLASATSDTWKAARAGSRSDDDARGLLRVSRLPPEADGLLGLALLDARLAPAVSIDPWLGPRGRLSLETDRGLAKALWPPTSLLRLRSPRGGS